VVLESEIDYTSSGGLIKYHYILTTVTTRLKTGKTSTSTSSYMPGSVSAGDYDQHGLLFTHAGGDPIDLKDLQMGFSSNDLGVVVDYNSVRAQAPTLPYEIGYNVSASSTQYIATFEYISGIEVDTPGYTAEDVLAASEKASNRYFVKVNPETSDDTIIRSGDRFKVYTDDSGGAWAIKCYIYGDKYEEKSFMIEPGTGNEWILSHKPSGQILARGDLYFPDNN